MTTNRLPLTLLRVPARVGSYGCVLPKLAQFLGDTGLSDGLVTGRVRIVPFRLGIRSTPFFLEPLPVAQHSRDSGRQLDFVKVRHRPKSSDSGRA